LPLSLAFLPDTLCLVPSQFLVFPPASITCQGMATITAFLLRHNHPLKTLLLVLAVRRRRLRPLPPELWELLIRDEFLSSK